ncbi:lysis system o-spanin lipoprotein Rz1 [Pseudomonas sp. R2-60-08W]
MPIAATCPVPPAPPAWAIREPSNSLQLLNKLFLIYEPGPLPIKRKV